MRLAALIFLVLLGCGSESKLTLGDTGSPAGSPREGRAHLQGKVWTVDGDPVAGAIVSVGARKAATNGLGFFVLQDLPVGQAVISAEAEGFGTTGAVRTLQDALGEEVQGEVEVSVTLLNDAGDPDSGENDPDGTRNDTGAFGGPAGAW